MEWTVPDLVNDVFRGGYGTRNAKTIPPELSIEGTINLLGGLPQDWGSCDDWPDLSAAGE
jgi:hypothetical protein